MMRGGLCRRTRRRGLPTPMGGWSPFPTKTWKRWWRPVYTTHIVRPAPRYGSEIATAAPFRARLLTACLRTLHAHCGERQSITSRDGEIRSVIPANAALGAELDIVICTTGADHLVDNIAGAAFRHH